tara:strand:- start:970 stop:3750 length:2781 start_codon:yes stop_codon:yes gene_type:complete
MADFTSAEIQAFKKMSYDEMVEYYNRTGINVMALDLKTIVASDLAEAIKDDTTDGATIEEKIERSSAHPMAKGSYKVDKTIQKKTETFTKELEKDTVKNVDTTEQNERNVGTYGAYKKRYAQDEAKFVHNNVLHQFASYNYIFTLSGLRESDVRFPSTIIGAPAHDIVAKSGGIGAGGSFSREKLNRSEAGGNDRIVRIAGQQKEEKLQKKYGDYMKFSSDILKENHDIYFERVNIEGVHAPNEDRKLMNFTKIEFELSEPFGVTLYEKLRGAASNCGYIDHMDAPFLLTLEFVGYDSKGNTIKSIEGLSKKYYPIKLVNSTVDINQAGSKYTLTAVPYTEFAMVNRFNYVRGPIEVTGNSIAEQFESIVNGIDAVQDTEIENKQRELKDEYRITFDPYFDGQQVESASDPMTFWNIGKFDVPSLNTRPGMPDLEGVDPGLQEAVKTKYPRIKALQMRDGTAIPTTLEAIMMRTSAYNDIATNFVEKYWKRTMDNSTRPEYKGAPPGMAAKAIQREYVPWFKIITSIYTHSDLDAITKMHRKTIHYHIQPYLIHIGNFVAPGLTGAGKWGKLVKKRYNYIYTGQNLDILDLNINYKYAFFQARMADASTLDHDSKQLQSYNEKKTEKMFIGRDGVYGDELFGVRSAPVSSGSQVDGEFASDKKSAKTREFYDYLTNPLADMIKVEMNIMGDPAWIGNDQYIPMAYMPNYDPKNPVMVAKKMGTVKGHTWSEETGSFNLDEAEPLVTLDFKFPTDFDEKAGTYNFNKSGKNVRFSGLYKVVKVTSNFENGQFTQDLLMIRIKNQGGTNATADPSIEVAKISKDDSEKKTTYSHSENAQMFTHYPSGETFTQATEPHDPYGSSVDIETYDMMNSNIIKHEINPGVKHPMSKGKKWDPNVKKETERYNNKRISIDPKTGKPTGQVFGGL